MGWSLSLCFSLFQRMLSLCSKNIKSILNPKPERRKIHVKFFVVDTNPKSDYNEEYRPLDQHRLCTDWNLPKQTVNSAVANLIQKGLVYLEPGKGRSKYIRPSEAGQKIIQEKIESIRRAECLALQQMTPEERRYLVALTDRYIGLLHTEMTREAEKFKRKGASEP